MINFHTNWLLISNFCSVTRLDQLLLQLYTFYWKYNLKLHDCTNSTVGDSLSYIFGKMRTTREAADQVVAQNRSLIRAVSRCGNFSRFTSETTWSQSRTNQQRIWNISSLISETKSAQKIKIYHKCAEKKVSKMKWTVA